MTVIQHDKEKPKNRLVRGVPYMGGQTRNAETKHKPAWLPREKGESKGGQAKSTALTRKQTNSWSTRLKAGLQLRKGGLATKKGTGREPKLNFCYEAQEGKDGILIAWAAIRARYTSHLSAYNNCSSKLRHRTGQIPTSPFCIYFVVEETYGP
eukprot:1156432-Pelagomonas_calceolata.AAC.8